MKTALPLLPLTAPAREVLLQPLAGCEASVMGMDVAEGCGAACIHCVGGHTGERYGAPTEMSVQAGVAQRLDAELEALAGVGKRPARIQLGLHSDPLWPAKAVREATHACIKVAFDRGVAVELHTRQVVPEETVALLKTHPHMVHVVVGVMTVRDSASRVYEAELPPAAGRLRAVRPLLAAGVPVTVRVDPLVPLVNDTEADLEALFALIAKNSVRRVELAYLSLSPESAKSLSRGLPRMHREMLKGLFAQEPWQDGPHGQRKLLPRVLRDAGYERAMTAARRVGLLPTVCASAEPDLKVARVCVRPLGDAPSARPVSQTPVPAAAPQKQQLGLFGETLVAWATKA